VRGSYSGTDFIGSSTPVHAIEVTFVNSLLFRLDIDIVGRWPS